MNFVSIDIVWNQVRRWFSVASAIVVIVGTLYVFATIGDEEKRLTIAVKQGVESVALKEIAHRFSRERHVSVEIIELPYDDLYEEEQRQLVHRPTRKRDSVPPFDVIMVDDPWLYALVSDPGDPTARRLRNLNDVLNAADNDFFPSTLSVSTYCPLQNECSEYFAVPFVANSQLFAYRGADFAEPQEPTTWKQVRDVSQEVEKKGGIGYVTRIGPGNSIVTDFMPILWAHDPESFPKFLKKGDALEQPESGFTTLKTLVATRKNLGSASFDDFDVSAYLQRQRASMGIVWSAWAIMLVDIDSGRQDFSRSSPSTFSMPDCLAKATKLPSSRPEELGAKQGRLATTAFKEKLIFGNVPLSSGLGLAKIQYSNDPKPGPELGVWLLAIPEEPKQKDPKEPVQKDLALGFIKYATDLGNDPKAKRRELSLLAAERGTPPPRMCVLAELQHDAKFADQHPSLIPAIAWSLDNGRARPRSACWKKIESRLGKYLEQLIDEELSPDCLTKCANQNLTPLFNQSKCEEFVESTDNEMACLAPKAKTRHQTKLR